MIVQCSDAVNTASSQEDTERALMGIGPCFVLGAKKNSSTFDFMGGDLEMSPKIVIVF